jgi:hypothetical protein
MSQLQTVDHAAIKTGQIYRICAQWTNPVTSEIHIFNSENIWFDPADHINTDEVTVLIERDNPKKYYVDISFLPKVAI